MNHARANFLSTWQEWKLLEARVANRDLSLIDSLEQDISRLRGEIDRLERPLFAALARDAAIFDPETERARSDMLRTQALETLKHLKVDPELWQNLASS